MLTKDENGHPINAFSPNPSKQAEPITVNAGQASDNIDVTGWKAISFRPSGDVDVYFNGATTKVVTFGGAPAEPHVIVLNKDITRINFKNNGGSAVGIQYGGM